MIETERLVLRRWEDRDRPAFRAMMADPRIVEFLGPVAGTGADAALDRHIGYFASHGLGFWAVERRADDVLVGQCGLKPGAEHTPIAGALEIGWALLPQHWGQGYAREAAIASFDWAWRERRDNEVAAITAIGNARSRGLMERLGMAYDPAGDFDHPAVACDSPLRRHVTYRIARPVGR